VLLAPEQGQVAPIAAEEMLTRLAWHGVDATIQRFDASLSELGAAFLAEAGKLDADLLVKGAYSQSRLRQIFLGGRTRHILAHTKIPVLLSH
jgi:nucleotide-binding universal stress UspA family protein